MMALASGSGNGSHAIYDMSDENIYSVKSPGLFEGSDLRERERESWLFPQ